MRLSRLFKKTLLIFIVLFGIIALCISLFSAFILYQRSMQEYENKALSIANSIARSGFEILLNEDAAAIQSLLDTSIDIESVSFVLYITQEQEIIAHTFSPEIPEEVRNITHLAQKSSEIPVIHSTTIGNQGNFFCIAVPLFSGKAGHIYIGISKAPIILQIQQSLFKMGTLILSIFLIYVIAAYLIMEKISRPLTILTDYAQRIAEGNFNANIAINSNDEIGILAMNMEIMAEKLQNLVKNLEESIADATMELHTTLNHLTVIFDNVADGLVVTDQHGTIIKHNHHLLRIFGVQKTHSLVGSKIRDLLGITIREIVDTYGVAELSDLTVAGDSQAGAMKTLLCRDFEYIASRSSDGTRFPAEISVSSIQIESGRTNIAVIRDITRRKKAEEELEQIQDTLEKIVRERTRDLSLANDSLLREVAERKRVEDDLASEKELLTTTMRSIGDGVITTDTTGRVMLMNKVAESLTGYTFQHARAKMLSEIFSVVSLETQNDYDPLVELSKPSGPLHSRKKYLLLTTRDVTQVEISLSISPIVAQDSQVIGSVLVFRDITLERKIEEEHLKAEKLTSLGILAGGIAHDFNNILTAILNNISLARLQIESETAISSHLLQAEAATQRAQKLTIQLLTFSKGGKPIRETASFADIVEESVSFALRGTNVSCDITSDENIWPVEVDKGQISQVIDNLAINAVQAMPLGGRIAISSDNIIIHDQGHRFLSPGTYVRCRVSDSGQGIAEHQLERIFDPYFTTKESGSGLGLATSYSIIKNHSGFIEVASQLSQGTTFTLYLPAIEGKAPAAQQAVMSDIVTGKGRVLIMDDEESIRDILGDTLHYLGYDTCFAGTGEEALQVYCNNAGGDQPVDLVIMDLTIQGGMGGKEAIAEILKINPLAKAIVSSGYSQDPVMANYRLYGFSGVLVKPYSIEDLSKKVAELMHLTTEHEAR